MTTTSRRSALWVVLLLAAVLLAAAPASQAQVRSVIPADTTAAVVITPTDSAILGYSLSPIPPGARIDSGRLLFVLKEKLAGNAGVVASYVGNPPKGVRSRQIDSKVLPAGTPAGTAVVLHVDSNFIIAALAGQLNISLKAPLRDSKATFWGSDRTNFSPRLLVYYSFKTRLPNWAGVRADARHSASTIMRFGGADSVVKVRARPLVSFNKVQTDLVMYNNLVYVIDNAAGQTSLYAIDPLTKYRTRAGGLEAAAQTPVIDPFGRLYYVSANKVTVIPLDDPAHRSTAVSLRTNEIVSNAPTSGRDGTLYLTLTGAAAANDYIAAYTPYPQHRLIWKCLLAGDKSPVALSPDEAIAYVVNRTGTMLAINTVNGAPLNSVHLSMAVKNNEGVTIPLVSSSGYVYVANKLIDADSLYVLDSRLNRVQAFGGVHLSQAVNGADSAVFFVDSGKLIRTYSRQAEVLASFAPNLSVRSLVADLSNNIYCLGNNTRLYIYSNHSVKDVASHLGPQEGFQKALVIAPDGSLYTATSTSLYTFRADSLSGDYTLQPGDAGLNYFVFRGNSCVAPAGYVLSGRKILIGTKTIGLGAKVMLYPGADITLESGGTTFIQNGFSVPVGARLTVRSGY
jgi:hypothetical protein